MIKGQEELYMSNSTLEGKKKTENGVKRLIFSVLAILFQVGFMLMVFKRLNAYAGAIDLFTRIFAIILVLKIYGRHQTSSMKMPWIILILAFPVMGVTLFLLVGLNGGTWKMRARYEKIDAKLLPLLPENKETQEKLQQQIPKAGNISSYLTSYAKYPVYQNTDMTYYDEAIKGLDAQLEDMKKAEKFIFMEYHAIEDEEAWQRIQAVLEERVKAGVEVRVFYDDMGSIGFISKDFMEKLKRKGIKCRVFNPLMPILNVFMNNRDHRKITVIDGKVGFTGGYNLANEYFNLTHPYGQWKDSGVKLTGDAVRSLTLIFMEMWNATQKEQEDPIPYLLKPAYRSAEGGYVQPYADSPLDDERTGENVYLNMIKSAKKYVYITTPYLIISDEMQRTLTLAAKSGVDVRIITPGIPDKPLIYKVTRSYYAGLAAEGIRIYEYTPGFIHSKQMVCDDEVAVVGTINMDFRSLYLHFENACWFAKCRAVLAVRHDFETLFPVCREVTEKYCQKRSLALRGWECILRMFSPLM